MIDKKREKFLTELAREVLNNIDPKEGIVFFDDFRDYLATKTEIDDMTLREEFVKMLSIASKGDKGKFHGAMRFVDITMSLHQNQTKKVAHKSTLKEKWRKWLKKRPKPKPRAPIAEDKKSAIKDKKKRRFYAALDFLFPFEVNKGSWAEADKMYEEAIKYGKNHRESVELALKEATEENVAGYNEAIAIALPRMKKWLKGLIIALGVIALIAIVIVLVVQLTPPPAAPVETTAITVAETAAPETTAVAETTAAPETTAGNIKFLQVKGNNAKNRVDADFEQKYADATQNATNLSDAQRKLLLDNSANNAFRLAIWSHAFGLYDDPNNWQPLVDGDYLSAEGEALYYKFEGAISAKGVIISKEKADEKAVNSGVSDGTYGTSSSPGITGNTDSIKVTLTDGSSTTILIRCGNVVNDDKDLPPVDTDEPKPPKKPPLEPKSSNEADYKQPGDGSETGSGTGDKPKVPEVTTPPESTPPVVDTTEVVNGVIETPINPPGSETGVNAPGSTPTETTSVPATEPGVNPGTGTNTGDSGSPF